MHETFAIALRRLALLIAFGAFAPAAVAGDKEDLHSLLNEFLANVESIEAHERFWADDLVYTSSRGTRTGKADIIAGMQAAVDDSDVQEPPVVYSAEDVDIRLYGDFAVVAFRLVAKIGEASAGDSEYFNTGTLIRRDGKWQVIAWQATQIPQESDSQAE